MLLQPWQIALIVIGGVLIIAGIVILIVLCKLKCCCFTCFECSCLNCCCADDSMSIIYLLGRPWIVARFEISNLLKI